MSKNWYQFEIPIFKNVCFVDFLKFKRSLYQVIALLPIFNVFLLCVNVVSSPEPMAQVS